MEETAEQQEPSSGLEAADPPDRSAGRETGSIPIGGGSKASLVRKIHAAQEVLEAGIGAEGVVRDSSCFFASLGHASQGSFVG